MTQSDNTTPEVTTAAALLALPEETFRQLVDSDLRGRSDPGVSQVLRSREVADRWYATLMGMAKSVEGQLAARRADAEAFLLQKTSEIAGAELRGDEGLADRIRASIRKQQEKDALWRGGIIRFKTGLEEVMAEARRIRDSHRDSIFETVIAQERNMLAARVRELELAIKAHRDHDCDDEDEPCDRDTCYADEVLWGFVS